MNQINPYLDLRDLMIAMVAVDAGIYAPGRAGQQARSASRSAHEAVRNEIARLQSVGAWSGYCEVRQAHYRDAMVAVDAVRSVRA
jgi:hypothetical protein